MRDIAMNIREYYDNAAEPVTADEVLDAASDVVRTNRRGSRWAFAAVAAALAVFALVGGPLVIFGLSDSSDPSVPPSTVVEPPASTLDLSGSRSVTVSVTVTGPADMTGWQVAGVLVKGGDSSLYPAVGGFAATVREAGDTITQTVREPAFEDWTPDSPGDLPFPYVTDTVLLVEPGTYTLHLSLSDRIVPYSRWVAGCGGEVGGPFNVLHTRTVRVVVARDRDAMIAVDLVATPGSDQCAQLSPDPGPEFQFNFADDNLCDWFTPEEFTLIVADAYTTHAITPIPDTAGLDCPAWPDSGEWRWDYDYDSYTNMEIVTPGQEAAWARSDAGGFEPYDGLDPNIQVRNLSSGCTSYAPGVSADLKIDGHDTTLSFAHFMPREFRTFTTDSGCDGDIVNPAGLAIAESMLRHLGWIE